MAFSLKNIVSKATAAVKNYAAGVVSRASAPSSSPGSQYPSLKSKLAPKATAAPSGGYSIPQNRTALEASTGPAKSKTGLPINVGQAATSSGVKKSTAGNSQVSNALGTGGMGPSGFTTPYNKEGTYQNWKGGTSKLSTSSGTTGNLSKTSAGTFDVTVPNMFPGADQTAFDTQQALASEGSSGGGSAPSGGGAGAGVSGGGGGTGGITTEAYNDAQNAANTMGGLEDMSANNRSSVLGAPAGDITGAKTGQGAYDYATGPTSFQNRQLALNALNAGGILPTGNNAADRAAAEAAVSAIPKGETQSPALTSFMDGVITGQDQEWNNIMKLQKQYERENAVSLQDNYNQLVKSSGLQALDTKLMNMENIINGTEGDIRTEVEKAGGFASESQVLGLATARNKTLIQNFNKLIDLRGQIEKQIDSQMALAKEDKASALDAIQQRMNLNYKIMEYKDKAQNNARESLRNVVSQVGYGGLLQMTGGDPRYMSKAEQILGLSAGGLEQLANYAPPMSEMDQLDIQLKKAQIANAYASANALGGGGASGVDIVAGTKPTGKPDYQAAAFSTRAEEANNLLSDVENNNRKILTNIINPFNWFGGKWNTAIRSEKFKSYNQAQVNFLTAVLRKESGANISPAEFEMGSEVYFAKPGDTPAILAQKQAARIDSLNGLIGSSGTAYKGTFLARPDNPATIGGSNTAFAGDTSFKSPSGKTFNLPN